MPFLQLQEHVSYGLVGDRPVFLDLKRDRYLMLDDKAAASFERLRRSDGSASGSEDELAPLLATGLFRLDDRPGNLAAVAHAAPERMPPARRGGGRGADASEAVRIWLLLRRVNRLLRTRPLEQIVSQRRRRPPTGEVGPAPGEIERLAGRFARARALVPAPPRCLSESLALIDWMAKRSAFPSLVFAVRLDPFAAHCWVQSGRTVLNDAPDIVAEYRPVLTL